MKIKILLTLYIYIYVGGTYRIFNSLFISGEIWGECFGMWSKWLRQKLSLPDIRRGTFFSAPWPTFFFRVA